jgi:ubiquinone/menaquinone biosynthesis C-methylase UbiE
MLLEMSTSDDAQRKAAATYNAAADFFDHPANTFWERYGRRTIELLGLTAGERVLDVCCGTGASAIPAAQAVGPAGSVIGVDLAENLLELARTKASQYGLTNVQFESGDMTALRFEDGSFDAVVCVFGIFFVPDMEAAVRELKRVVRPSGRVAITTWGPRLFEPVNAAFWNSVREVRPDLYKGFNPWDRSCHEDALHSLLADGGLSRIEVLAEMDSQPINSPDDWWAMVLGSGYRGTVDQLTEAERERIKNANFEFIIQAKIKSVEANVLYAQAAKENTSQ